MTLRHQFTAHTASPAITLRKQNDARLRRPRVGDGVLAFPANELALIRRGYIRSDALPCTDAHALGTLTGKCVSEWAIVLVKVGVCCCGQ
jgi:hypothetical protein